MNTFLKMKILESGKPQILVSREAGISETYLSRIVKGWNEPGTNIRLRLAEVLGCDVEDIFPQHVSAA
jgi:transcriptional regulator with XRE-family HTH domain